MSKEEAIMGKRKLLSEDMEVELNKFRVGKEHPHPVTDGLTIFQVVREGFGPNRGIGCVISHEIENGLELYRADIYGNIVYAKSEVSVNPSERRK